MSWAGRICRIYNVEQPGYYVTPENSDDKQSPLACSRNSESSLGRFLISPVEGSTGFHIISIGDRSDWRVVIDPEDLEDVDYPSMEPGEFGGEPFEWAIESVGSDIWRINIPGMDQCWSLPGRDYLRIQMRIPNDGDDEFWRIEIVDD
ncbi:hypothetical protein FRC09_016567 [Ceratobasidium sp. 395]|nr:hypothetical protein FRC09_016567 [Ceratobasidium sp. 395]